MEKNKGDYYIENEGFKPLVIRGEPIAYNSTLVQSEYNKLISASYYFSRKVGPIGLHVTFKKFTDGASGQVKNSGINEIEIDNICNTEFPMAPFREKFSGILDDDCCVDAGPYNLTNWTFEEHMKPVVKDFVYEKYVAHLRFVEKKNDVVTCILEHEIIMIFKDNDLKKFAARGRETGKDDKAKHKKDKSRGKSDAGAKRDLFF